VKSCTQVEDNENQENETCKKVIMNLVCCAKIEPQHEGPSNVGSGCAKF